MRKTVMYDSPLSDSALEERAAKLRAAWAVNQWECLSGVFQEAGDRLDYCYCCGHDLNGEGYQY